MTAKSTPPADEPLWRPSPDAMRETAMFRFMQQAADKHGINPDYDALYRWSIDRREAFWSDVWEFTGVQSSRRWDSILENGDAMPGAKWFAGSRLNFAENLLRYRDDQPAIIFSGENAGANRDSRRELTYQQLYAEVVRISELLKSLGVKEGERVAGYMTNGPEVIIAMLASASIGAIWSSCSPDFGVKGVLERFAQIKPRVLFAVDGYRYNGKPFDVRETVATVVNSLDSIEHLVVAPFLNPSPDLSPLRSASCNVIRFDEFKTTQTEMQFAQLPFDHPLYILYSSGTTGAPKCIVHGAGGTLLQHLKEQCLHTDLNRRDKLFFFTTCGWMMWNWLISGLASGCTLILYDGSPFFPRRRSLWQLAEQLGITVFGTSARYIAALAKARIHPGEEYDLSALRTLLSTGSPLAAENFDYVYQHIKSDLLLASVSGGTDIVSCFVLGNPLLPVYRGEIQCRGLGMAVDIYADDKATPAPIPIRGQRGELVCTKPFPSMPLGFWNEPDQQRYHDAYFARFPNIWAQGDYAELTEHDGIIIHGRSDAVLNPGGVRIGTAEIYRQVEKVDEILDSLCISQTWEGDVRIVLFVILREGEQLTEALKTRIRNTIQTNTTRRHVPKKIIAVPDIPRTLSGKIVELAVRNVVHGELVKNTEALANPEALEYFRGLGELGES